MGYVINSLGIEFGKIFRFDDVSCNTNVNTLIAISQELTSRFPTCKILYGMSPLIHGNCGERVYPKILNAVSDYRNFYKVDFSGIPFIPEAEIKLMNVDYAGHGLFHIDHRLLSFECQEMSIIASCSLANSKIFIPPFNKWDANTEMICQENGIELVKFEDGWRCLEYEKWDASHNLWYLHSREWTVEKLKKWFGDA